MCAGPCAHVLRDLYVPLQWSVPYHHASDAQGIHKHAAIDGCLHAVTTSRAGKCSRPIRGAAEDYTHMGPAGRPELPDHRPPKGLCHGQCLRPSDIGKEIQCRVLCIADELLQPRNHRLWRCGLPCCVEPLSPALRVRLSRSLNLVAAVPCGPRGTVHSITHRCREGARQ